MIIIRGERIAKFQNFSSTSKHTWINRQNHYFFLSPFFLLFLFLLIISEKRSTTNTKNTNNNKEEWSIRRLGSSFRAPFRAGRGELLRTTPGVSVEWNGTYRER